MENDCHSHIFQPFKNKMLKTKEDIDVFSDVEKIIF